MRNRKKPCVIFEFEKNFQSPKQIKKEPRNFSVVFVNVKETKSFLYSKTGRYRDKGFVSPLRAKKTQKRFVVFDSEKEKKAFFRPLEECDRDKETLCLLSE
jgi:hypothetical protein